jgi:hypothetical protein
MSEQRAADGEPVSFRLPGESDSRASLRSTTDGRVPGNPIEQQMSAFGEAEVIVVLKDSATSAASPASAPLAASIPVAASRDRGGTAQSVVMDLSKHFRISETSPDSVVALGMKSRKTKSAGLSWFRAYPKTERKAAADVEHDRNVICSSHGGGYVL